MTKSVFGIGVLTLAIAWSPKLASAANGDCAQPVSSGSAPTATDCLRILNVAVGLTTCSPHDACVCAPKGTLPTSATDALRCLSAAVGGSVSLDCPCSDGTTSTTTTVSTTTTTLADGECSTDAHCDDGEPCNGYEQCNGGSCGPGSPLACSTDDIVIEIPYLESPRIVRNRIEGDTTIAKVDAYLLLDRAPSVSDELTALKNGVTNAVRAAICAPTGTGSPPNCIQDLWTGVGGTGYSGSFGEAYRNRLDMQPDPAALSSRILTSEPDGCCARTTKLGLWSTASGLGNVTINCSIGSTYSSTGSCGTSPAGDDGIGYPCFRPDALRAVVLLTDEQPSLGHTCPTQSRVLDDSHEAGIRIVSLYGNGTTAAAVSELEAYAEATHAVDVNDGDAPLVFDASASVTAALTNAIVSLAHGTRLSQVKANAADAAGDAIDATQFIDALSNAPVGTAECTSGFSQVDTDFDGVADAYLSVPSGTPLCWDVLPAGNVTVPATAAAQLIRATVSIDDTGFEGLDTIQVFFVVPPS
jgi:hypothetical protein